MNTSCVECPVCGCELFIIKRWGMQCFLCRNIFGPKSGFASPNVARINSKLKYNVHWSDYGGDVNGELE